MKSKTKAFAILFTGIALAIGVAVSSGIIRNSFKVDEANAGTSTITLNNIGEGLTTTANETIETKVVGDYTLNYYQVKRQTSGTSHAMLLVKGKGAFISNKTAIPGSINSVKVSILTGASSSTTYYCYFGTSEFLSIVSGGTAVNIAGGNSYTYNNSLSGATYFCVSLGNSNNGQVLSLEINYDNVPDPILQSITVTTQPTKKSYFLGESFDSTGMVVEATYDVGEPIDVTNQCEFEPSIFNIAGENIEVVVSYTDVVEKETTFSGITVSTRSLTSLEVTSQPAKIVYTVGESFDPAGMIVKANYDAGDPVLDYKGYTYSPTGTLNNLGSQLITITDSVDTLISTSVTVQVNEAPEIEDLFISEYIEGSSSNKAIEIFNGTNSTINLGVYSLKLYANGSSTPNTPILSLSGSLANGETYVVADASANASIQAVADITHAVTFFGGDDAIGLYKNDLLIDVIGEIGNDPGTAWTGKDANNNDASTAEMTLVRHPSILSPNTTFALSEWIAYATDTVTYLGSHTVNVSAPQYELDAIAWGASFISETATGCNEFDQAQLLTAWSGLATSFNALSSDAKNYLTTLTPNELGNDAQHAVARYTYIITKYGEETFDDFMNLDIQSAPSFFEEAKANNNSLTIIITISVIGLTVLLGYYYLNKKKEA